MELVGVFLGELKVRLEVFVCGGGEWLWEGGGWVGLPMSSAIMSWILRPGELVTVVFYSLCDHALFG